MTMTMTMIMSGMIKLLMSQGQIHHNHHPLKICNGIYTFEPVTLLVSKPAGQTLAIANSVLLLLLKKKPILYALVTSGSKVITQKF